ARGALRAEAVAGQRLPGRQPGARGTARGLATPRRPAAGLKPTPSAAPPRARPPARRRTAAR
ncbi:MAG: sugar ABC transporter ATP-binding protein, partial [bacterium]